MKVIFSHGKESGPWGTKIQRLATIAKEHGCSVESIDYTGISDPDMRVAKLVSLLKNETETFILVGSSMGGYVSLVASEQVKPKAIFLMAPALYIANYKQQLYSISPPPTEIVHGWEDIVIAPENSIHYAKQANCSLHLIPGDHSLISSLDTVADLFKANLSFLLPRDSVSQKPLSYESHWLR